MFEVKTTLRTLYVEASDSLAAMRMGCMLAVNGELLTSVHRVADNFPFLIVEIKA